MPRGKSKVKQEQSQDDDSGEDDHQPTQTQSLTQKSQAEKAAKLTKEDLDKKVNDMVRYLLITDQRKVPIKKQDINKHVMKEHSKLFPEVLEQAKQKLKQVFGLDLVELDSKQKSYILVNQLEGDTEEEDVRHIQWSPQDNARMGVLMVILGSIFMSGNVMQDATLWHMLRRLGLDIEQNHEEFGDIKRLVTQEFVREGYLEYTRQPATDPPTFEFRWGQRAKLETTKRNVLDFVCQIYGDTNPEQWVSQYQDIMREEQPDMANGHVNGTQALEID